MRKDQATIYDIVRYALGRRNADMTQRDRLRIVAILNAIGWVYSHKSDGRSAYRRVSARQGIITGVSKNSGRYGGSAGGSEGK